MKTTPRIHKVSVTATATRAVQDNPNRVGLCIYNNEEANIVELIANEGDPYGKGIPIPPKDNYENLHYCQGEYWLICDTGETADCRVEEDIKEV